MALENDEAFKRSQGVGYPILIENQNTSLFLYIEREFVASGISMNIETEGKRERKNISYSIFKTQI